ncbi:MAG: heterodisulfide reductase-related iron-sulfur binding cluster [Deltaproteobacteria bacterium]
MGEWSYNLYTGCLIRSRFPHVEKSARVVFDRLGVEIREIANVGCCPEPVGMRSLDEEVWLTVAARNMSVLSAANRPVMTLCNGCYSTFRESEHLLSANKEYRETVNRHLASIGREYAAGLEVDHFARFLYEKIGPARLKELVVAPLRGLNVAFHAGCHLVRPFELLAFDDPENPTKIEELLRALGAEVVDYPRKSLCCGFTIMGVDADLSLKMGFEKLKNIKASGAQAVVVVCPACLQQFDVNQRQMERKFGAKLGLPVFYLTELIALALGESPESLGLDLHRTEALSLVQALGLTRAAPSAGASRVTVGLTRE